TAQDPRGGMKGRLGAAGDDDLIRLRRDAAGPLEIFGEGRAQRRVAGRVGIAAGVAGRAPRPRGQEASPDFSRELVDGRLSVAKVVAEIGAARARGGRGGGPR